MSRMDDYYASKALLTWMLWPNEDTISQHVIDAQADLLQRRTGIIDKELYTMAQESGTGYRSFIQIHAKLG